MDKYPGKIFLKVFVGLALVGGGIISASVLGQALRQAGVQPLTMRMGFLVVLALLSVVSYLIFLRHKSRQ